MATRNERKAKAKARGAAIQAALLEQAKATEAKLVMYAPRQDVFDVPKAIRGHRQPAERLGAVVKGKFVAKPLQEPAKRKLTLVDGRLIEKKRGYFG